jgi:hypothetical protein
MSIRWIAVSVTALCLMAVATLSSLSHASSSATAVENLTASCCPDSPCCQPASACCLTGVGKEAVSGLASTPAAQAASVPECCVAKAPCCAEKPDCCYEGAECCVAQLPCCVGAPACCVQSGTN